MAALQLLDGAHDPFGVCGRLFLSSSTADRAQPEIETPLVEDTGKTCALTTCYPI